MPVTGMPHVSLGDPIREELIRIVEAYLRDHDIPMLGMRTRLTVPLCNTAIDWWNTLEPEDDGLIEAIAHAWMFGDCDE